MNVIERLHEASVYSRRARRLSEHMARFIPKGARVLDVGCGDGLVSSLVTRRRPDIDVQGVDVLHRDHTHIPVDNFDGRELPYGNGCYDVVMFVDVLHHTGDPMILLEEAARVASKAILVKDHTCNGILADEILRFMDFVGNARYGVALPYNYWTRQRWFEAFDKLHLKLSELVTDLGLYPWPANYIFDRSLHFIARLDLEGGEHG